MTRIPRLPSSWQSKPRSRHVVHTGVRGSAGAVAPLDPVPFDVVAVRPEIYHAILAKVDNLLTTAAQELAALTPPELELCQLRQVLIQTRDWLRARRTRSGQLALLTPADPEEEYIP
jgi:hypothetical protein